MKFKYTIAVLCLFAIGAKAQNTSYAQKAEELQKEIWGTTEPEFKQTKVADSLANESAVIIARSFSAQRDISNRFKFMIITADVVARNIKVNTFHERVKINDKAALDKFSQLEYQKTLDNNVSLGIVRYLDNRNTYVGAKIIKPDGKEIIVNTSEEVLTKNESKDKQGKIAISDLVVGDILDYYVCNMVVTEKTGENSFSDNDNLVVLANEYPILYYNLSFQFNKNVLAKYISANNAPTFVESTKDNGDKVYSLTLRNLPKYGSQLWSSPLRHYPYVVIGSAPINSTYGGGDKKLNKLSMLERNKAIIQKNFVEFQGFNEPIKKLAKAVGGKSNLKKMDPDDLAKLLYDQWKFQVFCEYSGDELDNVTNMNYRRVNSIYGALWMSMMLTDLDVDHDILFVSSRFSNSLKNSFNISDFNLGIRLNNNVANPKYMFFEDVVTQFNQVPSRFQGEWADVMHPKRITAMNYTLADRLETQLPTVATEKNYQKENILVSLMPDNMQKLKIERNVKVSGSLRNDVQKLLIPVRDVDSSLTELVKGEPLEKRLLSVKRTKKMGEDYKFVFNKEHEEMSKNFTTEIKNNMDQEPEQLTDYKIVSRALDSANAAFEYSAKFVLNNLVKKAGGGFIIDAGKLTGLFLKVEEKDKKRDQDIYMSAARTYNYAININIPQGYSATGVEEFNTKKTNTTGTFLSNAKVEGNTLVINVTQTYNQPFIKAKDWSSLLDIIQTSSEFNDKKILLEKKG